MATTQIFVKGKVMWAHVQKIDKYGKYSAVLYPDAESLDKIKALVDGKPPILNALKQDEQGYSMKFSCPPERTYQGKVMPMKVDVLDKDSAPFYGAIGNGSDVTMMLDVYTYRKGEGKAVRVRSIRVDNLIPYDPNTFPELTEDTKELAAQPAPVWS